MHASLAGYSPTTWQMHANLAGYSPTTWRMRANEQVIVLRLGECVPIWQVIVLWLPNTHAGWQGWMMKTGRKKKVRMMPWGFRTLPLIVTCKPGHCIIETQRFGGERSMKHMSLVVIIGGRGLKVPKEGLDPHLTKMTGPRSRGT
jgi:hypothetical protein